jgi:hypothetical protein
VAERLHVYDPFKFVPTDNVILAKVHVVLDDRTICRPDLDPLLAISDAYYPVDLDAGTQSVLLDNACSQQGLDGIATGAIIAGHFRAIDPYLTVVYLQARQRS